MIEALNKENPEYRDRKGVWQRYWDFYVGGEQLRRNASLYMVRRQKEPNDVYLERLSRVFYENYLGSCVDWYAATLFRTPPSLSYRTSNPAVENFFTEFGEDCDCRGTSLLEMARRVFIQCLVFRESYVLIDFPRVAGEVSNRAEEDAVGKSRAYLVNYSAPQLINWKTDGNGAFEWVVLKTHRSYQESFDGPELVSEDQWAYYDRENFRTYRLRRTERGGNGGGADGSDGVELVNQGRHGLAEIRRVPLVKLTVTDGLWLANKAALLQQEHFNKSNALAWALHMGLFAMPVIYSEREWQQIVGEAYYIQLGPNDRFGWDEGTERSTDMDLKAYYRKVREIEASIEDEFPLIKSLATEDGGAGGQLTEVTRAIAARRFFDGIAEPAMPDEVRDYRKNTEEARKKEEQRRRSAEIQFTILSEADLRALQGASRNAAVGGWRPRLMGPGVVWVSPFGIAGEPRLALSECPVSFVGGECLAFVEDFSAYVAAGGRVVGLRPVLDGWISTAVARGPPASTVCAVKDCAVTNAAVAVFTS